MNLMLHGISFMTKQGAKCLRDIAAIILGINLQIRVLQKTLN